MYVFNYVDYHKENLNIMLPERELARKIYRVSIIWAQAFLLKHLIETTQVSTSKSFLAHEQPTTRGILRTLCTLKIQRS